jgi:pyruvate kinase
VHTRRTRILATLGPATSDPATIGEVILAGADAVRLNFSHGGAEVHAESCRMARAEAARLGRVLTVLQDLGGPKIRTGKVAQPLLLASGDHLRIVFGDMLGEPGVVSSAFAPLFTSVSPGQRMLLDDGRLEVVVTDVRPGEILTRVIEGGVLDSRKGIHVPGSVVQTAALTAKDHDDLRAGIAMGVDVVALSFVQGPEDILQAKEAARVAGAPGLPIIAKIERPLAVERIREIVEVSDGVMVARGDLGIELPLETVPAVQKLVIQAARRRGVPVIVATEVLESMRTSPRPTRAEVTDAAHAVDEGADAIMLSGETAVGQYPVRCVATLSAIIGEAERALARGGAERISTDDVRATQHGLALCEAAVALAARAGAAAIIAVTKAGMTPRVLSALRPSARIIAATANPQTAARLGLVWGVTPVVTEAATLAAVRDTLLARMLVPAGSTVVFVAMHATLERDASNYLTVERM